MDNITGFLQSYNCNFLQINVNKNTVAFEVNGNKHSVKINLVDNKLVFSPDGIAIETAHFVSILNESEITNIDQLPELMHFIKSLNLHNYCIVCHQKMDFQSNEYVTCGSEKCLYDYEELIIGNYVIEKFKGDLDKCKFLIESALDAITCERKYDIFEPFPKKFLKYNVDDMKRGDMSKLTGQSYDDAKDFNKINALVANFDIKTLEHLTQKCKNDIELSQELGKDMYILIRFILMSCKVDIVQNDDMLDIKSNNFKIYKITHPLDKEDEFKAITSDIKTDFLFHGSRWCNWFSILRNGLKNCSNSKLMTAGAAYGKGVYLSDDINLSYQYGKSGKKSVVGVFELINKEKYNKGNNIYVVDDEKILIQRYLLIIPQRYVNDLKMINGIFNKQIYEEKAKSVIQYNKKSIAKIVREYKLMSKLKNSVPMVRVELDPNFIFEWKIFCSKFDNNSQIARDMNKLNIEEIELEIRFPQNYPFGPPFIRVVRPRFARLTGHVTSTGSFCNELLTEKGWSPTYTVEAIVISLMSELVEGDGRIDKNMYNIPYSYEEAREGFIRVAKSHGWM